MNTRVTAIPADCVISVNGESIVFDFEAPKNIHAIQWYENNSGEVEYNDGTSNKSIKGDEDYKNFVLPYVNQWKAEKARLEEEASQPPTMEELQQAFTNAVQEHLDSFAQTRNYDGIMSAATYATSAVPKFRSEGQYAVEARDETWNAAFAIIDAVKAGKRETPETEDALAELPVLRWPG